MSKKWNKITFAGMLFMAANLFTVPVLADENIDPDKSEGIVADAVLPGYDLRNPDRRDQHDRKYLCCPVHQCDRKEKRAASLSQGKHTGDHHMFLPVLPALRRVRPAVPGRCIVHDGYVYVPSQTGCR